MFADVSNCPAIPVQRACSPLMLLDMPRKSAVCYHHVNTAVDSLMGSSKSCELAAKAYVLWDVCRLVHAPCCSNSAGVTSGVRGFLPLLDRVQSLIVEFLFYHNEAVSSRMLLPRKYDGMGDAVQCRAAARSPDSPHPARFSSI